MVDWGLAKPMGRVEPGREMRRADARAELGQRQAETLPGSALGTPAYMSPEQARGDLDRLGPRSDVYSLGATLYCLLTGRPPFEGDDIGELLRKVQRGDFAPPRQLDPTIDPALEAVCLKAMATEPEDRYATCRALADDIERWMADEPVTAWREPLSRRARRWARRNRTAVTVAGRRGAGGAGRHRRRARRADPGQRPAPAGQRRARRLANVREKQRFDLAMEAIKLFHGEVGDDLVLKADQFKPLRDKLLQGAADFYGRLEGLLKGQPDRASRACDGECLLRAGRADREDRRQARRPLRSTRRGWRSGARWPRSRPRTARPAATWPAACSRPRLARRDRPLRPRPSAAMRRPVSCWKALPLTGPGSEERRSLARPGLQRDGGLLGSTGKTAEMVSAYERSLEILTRLVDENPAVSEYRSNLADTHNRIGIHAVEYRQTGRGPGIVPSGAGDRAEAGRRQPHRPRFPEPVGHRPQQHRLAAVAFEPAGRGAGVAPAGAGDPAEAGRRQPCRHGIPGTPGDQPQQHRRRAVGFGPFGRGTGVAPSGAGDRAEAGR